jgi:hypothetical protein
LRELVEDRVARAERPELDASGKPTRWMPPTEPAPPRPPKPERSGRGPKSQRSERGPVAAVPSRCETFTLRSWGTTRRPMSPGAKFRRPAKGVSFQDLRPVRFRRGLTVALARVLPGLIKNRSVLSLEGERSAASSRRETPRPRSWYDGSALRSRPELSTEPAWRIISFAPGTTRPCRKIAALNAEKSMKIRTHRCGELTKAQVGQQVVLNGWVQRRRDHGMVLFIDLRDRTGFDASGVQRRAECGGSSGGAYAAE